QRRRSAHAGTYSPWNSSLRGTRKPSMPSVPNRARSASTRSRAREGSASTSKLWNIAKFPSTLEMQGHPFADAARADVAKALAAIGGQHAPALSDQNAGQDQRAAGGQVKRHVGREAHQRPGENVGDDQVEAAAMEQRMIEAACRHRVDERLDAVQADV